MRHLLLAVLILVGFAVSAWGYTIEANHPRLFFTENDIDTLQIHCVPAGGVLHSDYLTMKNYCTNHINDNFPLANADLYEHESAAYGFVHRMESGDTTYAHRAKTIGRYILHQSAGAPAAGSAPYIRSMAILYDWCYDTLAAEGKTSFGGAIATGGLIYKNASAWGATNNYHSKLFMVGPLAYAGLALGDDGVADAAGDTLLALFRLHTFGAANARNCVDEIAADGSYFEGDYSGSTLGDFRTTFLMWDVAITDEAPFDSIQNLDSLAQYMVFEVGPKYFTTDGYHMLGSKQGDSYRHTLAFGDKDTRTLAYSYAKENKSRNSTLASWAQWLGNQIKTQGLGAENSYDRWKLITRYDPTVSASAPDSTAHLFNDMGTAYMRSGWDLSETSTDIYAVFRCERLNYGHSHAHQNHFMISRGNDPLALDSGWYDGTTSIHQNNYAGRTIAHNCITVYDPDEHFWKTYTHAAEWVNDGGQFVPKGNMDAPPVHYGDASATDICARCVSPYVRGKTVGKDYVNNSLYTYVRGNAQPSYGYYDPISHQFIYKTGAATREFVWLKADSVFVILDRVQSSDANHKKTWLLHTINQPVAYNASTYTVTSGTSKMFVQTLLPHNRTFAFVGGSGHEFDVNGTNYPPLDIHGVPLPVSDDMGRWRMEVSPQVPQTDDLFLTALYITSAGTDTMPTVTCFDGIGWTEAEDAKVVPYVPPARFSTDVATREWVGDPMPSAKTAVIGCMVGTTRVLFTGTGVTVDIPYVP